MPKRLLPLVCVLALTLVTLLLACNADAPAERPALRQAVPVSPSVKATTSPITAMVTPSSMVTATPTPSEATPSPETDREALAALYNATGGGNWARGTNWLSDAPIGEWEGVTTDGYDRVV